MSAAEIHGQCERCADVCAVVVAYKPAPAQLVSLIRSLAAQCGDVLVIDNGGAAAICATEPDWPEQVACVAMAGNAGLGAALNRGFALARDRGARYVISFDQDSAPRTGTVSGLLHAHQTLTDKGQRVAAVGPRFVDDRYGGVGAFPFMRLVRGWPRAIGCSGGAEFVETDFLITSGCLVSLSAYETVGEFDVGMFVDCTDVEWGFRANSMGFKLYGVCSVTMRHELGLGESATILGLTILSYSPVRRYYQARATVRLLQLPHVPWAWKLRMSMGLMGRWIFLPFRRSTLSWRGEWRMYGKGIWAGLRGVRGGISDYDEPRHQR